MAGLDVGDLRPEEIAGLRELISLELSKKSLIAFGERVFHKFQSPVHIRYLAGLLERCERGDIRRLAISIAPGHGKSSLLQIFLAYFLGRDPHRKMLALSASEALAFRNSRIVREIVRGEKWPWAETRLVGESLEEWYTSQGGGVRAIGRTGNVTGFRAQGVLLDDVQKDYGTEESRQKDEEWFREILATRVEPGGFAVAIATRWGDDDLIGRLEQGDSASQWVFVNIPVLCEDPATDPMGRAEGEPLWPGRWPLDELEKIRIEVGPVAWAAQYMGDPVPRGGATFHADWFGNRYHDLPALPLKALVVDSAWKTGPRNDYSVLGTWGTDQRDYWLVDISRGKWEFPELQRRVVEKFHEQNANAVVVEDAASGSGIIQQLRTNTGLPVIAVKPTVNKESRAQAVTPYFEAGRVHIPATAPWLQEWLNEHLRFPAGKHDDQVDTTSMAISWLNTRILPKRPDYTHLRGFMSR